MGGSFGTWLSKPLPADAGSSRNQINTLFLGISNIYTLLSIVSLVSYFIAGLYSAFAVCFFLLSVFSFVESLCKRFKNKYLNWKQNRFAYNSMGHCACVRNARHYSRLLHSVRTLFSRSLFQKKAHFSSQPVIYVIWFLINISYCFTSIVVPCFHLTELNAYFWSE